MDSNLLRKIPSYSEIKSLSTEDLVTLSSEIRSLIIDVVSKNGGHLASSLGATDLILSLHKAFDFPKDKIFFDVGHQCYAHKIITDRKDKIYTLRKLDGLSGFVSPSESPFDSFTAGHAGNSISAALGAAVARDLDNETHKVIAFIGDASIGTGMALEAMNNAGSSKTDLILVLNDNKMSISPNVGAISKYLNNIITGKWYNRFRNDFDPVFKSIVGNKMAQFAKRIEEGFKNSFLAGGLFEELGFKYVGPVDGHDIAYLVDTFKRVSALKYPILVHAVTTKGKGYKPAELESCNYHGVAPFDLVSSNVVSTQPKKYSYTDIFSSKLVEIARKDEKVVAITAAMGGGTGLAEFASLFPNRYFDVGIAEQHAVTFAAGLASRGYKPVVAIYSTFLQRSIDQIIHDVATMNLNITFAIDRAGIVGEDGATHHGIFDTSILRTVPGMVSMAPKDGEEFKSMLEFAIGYEGMTAIRYPRGVADTFETLGKSAPIALGKAELIQDGDEDLVLALGSTFSSAYKAVKELEAAGHSGIAIINPRFIKPLDADLLTRYAKSVQRITTIEENLLDGGFGSAVLELLADNGITNFEINRIGIKDSFISHGSQSELRSLVFLDSVGIKSQILKQRQLGNLKNLVSETIKRKTRLITG